MLIRDFFQALWRNALLVAASRHLAGKHWRLTARLALYYQGVDRSLSLLRRRSGLKCVPECGQCCRHVYAEASVLEMLPLASVLIRRKRADLWIQKLARLPEEGRCIFYHADPKIATNGRCRIYALRPLICRLFGFVIRRNKGKGQVLTCRRMKDIYPHQVDRANQLAAQGGHVTYADIHREELTRLSEPLGRTLYALPRALYQAMMYAGLYRQIRK